MNKALIIILIIIVVGAAVWAIFFQGAKEEGVEVTAPEKETVEEAKEAGYGWSVKDSAAKATKEAVQMMEEKLGGDKPDYVLIWYTIAYDSHKIQSSLRELLGSDVQIQGNSSVVGVITPDGYHVGDVGSLAILGVSSNKVNIGVGGANLKNVSPRKAGKNAIQEAIANAGKEGDPDLVYMTGAPGKEEGILLGIEDVVGTDTPIMGGSSGDETLKGKWSQIANNQVSVNGVSLGAVYTDLEMGRHHEFGYKETVNKGTVTKAEGRTLYEINGKPAAEVYNEWTGGHFDKKLKEGGRILSEASFYPLAKIIQGEEGQTYMTVSHPGGINLPEKSLTTFTDLEKGDKLKLLQGNWELLVNRAQSTARKAMQKANISRGEGLFAFYTFCGGNLLVIPEGERGKIPHLLQRKLGNIPFVGGFTLGEQVFLPGVGNRHANLVNSLAIFKSK